MTAKATQLMRGFQLTSTDFESDQRGHFKVLVYNYHHPKVASPQQFLEVIWKKEKKRGRGKGCQLYPFSRVTRPDSPK